MPTLIHQLANSGDLTALRSALRDSGINETRDGRGYTPLMAAIMSDNASVDVVRCLIENGADVNAESSPPPALELDPEQLDLLEEAGVDRTLFESVASHREVDSVLTLAVQHGPLDKIRLLLDSGADVEWVDPNGYSTLLRSLYRKVSTSDTERRQLLESLIQAGAPLDVASSHGETALSVASGRCELSSIRLLLAAGAAAGVLDWNDVFHSVAFGDLADVDALPSGDPRLRHTDAMGRTPFLFAIRCGRLDMARLLLRKGSDSLTLGRSGHSAMALAIDANRPEIIEWLLAEGVDVAQSVNSSDSSALSYAIDCDKAECVELLIRRGADVFERDEFDFDLMHEAYSSAVIRILHSAGLSLNGLPSEPRCDFLGLDAAGPLAVSQSDYERHFQPRFGTLNPHDMGNPFWNEMVRKRLDAYTAGNEFGESDCISDRRPVWCFQRFGQSLTQLPSGQFVEIAGEHEDAYDPDFCIYNDVVVHDGCGRFRIFGYPSEVFPPTDFHSATFLDGHVYIIGNLGYPDDRQPGVTPVYRLCCDTWSIKAVPVSGQMPGWISSHRAELADDGRIRILGGKIWDGEDLVDNDEEFSFEPRTGKWSLI